MKQSPFTSTRSRVKCSTTVIQAGPHRGMSSNQPIRAGARNQWNAQISSHQVTTLGYDAMTKKLGQSIVQEVNEVKTDLSVVI